MAEAVAKSLIPEEVRVPPKCSCKMIVLITCLALAVIGIVASAVAGHYFETAAFGGATIGLIISIIYVRRAEKLKCMTELLTVFRQRNIELARSVQDLQRLNVQFKERLTTLGEIEEALRADKNAYRRQLDTLRNINGQIQEAQTQLRETSEKNARIAGKLEVHEQRLGEIATLFQDTLQEYTMTLADFRNIPSVHNFVTQVTTLIAQNQVA
ncbi:MAG: hypothetical protein MRY21_02325 [Simkaniaceae bacterium]|nr:hypothetical protein [Simkaniaceae bacterium]